MKRRLIIDAQVFQTPAKDRGMGKYSIELLVSMVPLALKWGWSSVELLFSTQFQEESYSDLISPRLKDVSYVPLELQPNDPGNPKVTMNNRQVIDKYILSTNQGQTHIDFLILSLMQGQICPVFPSGSVGDVNRYLLFYDIVPLMFHEMYLDNPITNVELTIC